MSNNPPEREQREEAHPGDSRPDVNDPNTVDRLARDAIRILSQKAQQSSRKPWWKREKK